MDNSAAGRGNILRGRTTMKILRNILWGVVIFNVISVISFWLPPGRAYYMPGFLMNISMWLFMYAIWALSIVNAMGAVATLMLIIYSKIKNYPIEKNYIILLILFLLGILFGWFLFNMAMSV